MNTEIASSPLYPSVHLLLRASKLAAPVSVAAKTAHSVHASPSGTVKSFSVLNCDCSSTAECRGAVTPGGKESENKIRKKKKTRELSLRSAHAATVFFASCWSHRSGRRRASKQGRGNVVSVRDRSFLKGAAPLLLRCRREGRLGDQDVAGNASAEDRLGAPTLRIMSVCWIRRQVRTF